ncbi:hypothetical protein BKA70DRAFT_1219748 [Coprinopsis sp. MPI-PUGE-AT-0042]|nr:hypothetical protein BKA70DRAFT_1219748 [Coprinopsis sp. MPI-PUGE-AT-0042]
MSGIGRIRMFDGPSKSKNISIREHNREPLVPLGTNCSSNLGSLTGLPSIARLPDRLRNDPFSHKRHALVQPRRCPNRCPRKDARIAARERDSSAFHMRRLLATRHPSPRPKGGYSPPSTASSKFISKPESIANDVGDEANRPPPVTSQRPTPQPGKVNATSKGENKSRIHLFEVTVRLLRTFVKTPTCSIMDDCEREMTKNRSLLLERDELVLGQVKERYRIKKDIKSKRENPGEGTERGVGGAEARRRWKLGSMACGEVIKKLNNEVERLVREVEVLRGVLEEGLSERRATREASMMASEADVGISKDEELGDFQSERDTYDPRVRCPRHCTPVQLPRLVEAVFNPSTNASLERSKRQRLINDIAGLGWVGAPLLRADVYKLAATKSVPPQMISGISGELADQHKDVGTASSVPGRNMHANLRGVDRDIASWDIILFHPS